ncbi:MAG TPA: type II secretion system F family protein [Candidatus Binatia bacterium]|nr:type II secretion system F family protein [Candidatus Binatia bacterium]
MIASLAAVLTFVAVVLLVLAFRPARSAQANLLEARLAQFTEAGRVVQSLAEVEMTLPFFERAIRPTLDKWGRVLASRNSQQRTQALQEKLNLAGRPWGLTVGGFLVLKFISVIVFALVGIGIIALLYQVMGNPLQIPQYVIGIFVGGVVGYLLPDSLLSRRIRSRQHQILLALPSALDLLTISVEAGLGFDAALGRVCEKYHNALSAEFNQVLNEIRLGRPRLEAMDDMARRNKVEELNSFIQAIIQSEQLGVGIANVLRIQSEEIRRRRRQRAEEAGQKAPLKMLFPMACCIFPTLFIVLLGPAVLTVAQQFNITL